MLTNTLKSEIEKIILDNLILSEKGEAHGARLDIILCKLSMLAQDRTLPQDRETRLLIYKYGQKIFSNNVYLFK
jgi:hypothetical protein